MAEVCEQTRIEAKWADEELDNWGSDKFLLKVN